MTLQRLLKLASVALLLLCSACGEEPTESPEALAEEAFEMIKEGRWFNYNTLIVTESELLADHLGVELDRKRRGNQPSMEDGPMMAPEDMPAMVGANIHASQDDELALHRVLFERARRGGKDQIDFAHGEWVALGPVLEEGEGSVFGLTTYPRWVYGLRVEGADGEERPAMYVWPRLVITRYQGEYRIVALQFPEMTTPDDARRVLSAASLQETRLKQDQMDERAEDANDPWSWVEWFFIIMIFVSVGLMLKAGTFSRMFGRT